MCIDVVLSFSDIHPSSRAIVARTLELVPFVSAGLLESCDIGVARESASLLLRAHLHEAPGAEEAIARLSSLVERANGVAVVPAARGGDAPAGPEALLERAERTERGVAPAALSTALDRALRSIGEGGREARGGEAGPVQAAREPGNVRYDALRRELSLTSELAIPVGHRLPLAIHSPSMDGPVLGSARVVRLRREGAAPGCPGGSFTVTLVPDGEALHAGFVLAAAGEATIAAFPGEAPLPRRKVLLIDGLPERLDAFAEAIRGAGFDLTVISPRFHGIPALALIAADLVLLTTADPVRAEAPLRTCRVAGARDLPVLVASAAPPAHDALLLHAGADVVVSSAVPARELVDTVRALLGAGIPPAAAPHANVDREATRAPTAGPRP